MDTPIITAPIKVITLWQPWASLIAIGAKRFETRSWRTNYRGPIAIHAAKKSPHDVMRSLPHKLQVSIYDSFYDHYDIASGALKRMPTGCIVAVAELKDCFVVRRDFIGGLVMLQSENRRIHFETKQNEFLYGDYTEGRYAWLLTDVKPLDTPIQVKGQQGLWTYRG